MTNERIQELMSRSLSGEATGEELQELEGLLATDGPALTRYKVLQQYWNQHDAVSTSAVEDGLQNLLAKLDLTPTYQLEQPRILWWRRLAAAAAIITVMGGIGYFYYKSQNKPTQLALLEKQNARGTKSIIELTDGSKIWLNADSKIQYPQVFSGNTREVYLNGEAFFEVAKNADKPFIIHLANGTVRVLGTSFNVRAYDDEKVVETSVATGKVAFIPKTHRQQPDTIFLTPNNKVRYTLEEEQVKVLPTAAEEDKAWTEGRLIFKGDTLEDIALELERNFGRKVVFLDDAPRAYRLTGSFQRNSLDEIMYYLSQTKDFYYKITNSELLITSDESKLP